MSQQAVSAFSSQKQFSLLENLFNWKKCAACRVAIKNKKDIV